MLTQTVVQGHTFSISNRYQPKKILGKGSFGVVCSAFDSQRKADVAIKRIRPFANDEWDARHTLREVRLLKLLGPHPNVISLYDLSVFEEKAELYMVMELMDCDMHRIIQSKQPLSEAHYKCFARQLLEGIHAMHRIGIFHRDLKPGNLLVSKDCQLRITDFGLARFMDEGTLTGNNRQNPMTEYVVTRWYRCPELLLSPNKPYSAAIDIWSIGCILAELIRRTPLFPGKSHANQLQLILEIRGYRSAKDLGFDVGAEALAFLDRRCRYPGKPLSAVIPSASAEALQLLEALLRLNPTERPSAQEAIQFAYVSDAQVLCNYADFTLPSAEQLQEEFFSFEHKNVTLDNLRELILKEVASGAAPPVFPDPSRESADRLADTENIGFMNDRDNEMGAVVGEDMSVTSRTAPPTPSPQKQHAIEKQEKKQKRRFFLQGLQRMKQQEHNNSSSYLDHQQHSQLALSGSVARLHNNQSATSGIGVTRELSNVSDPLSSSSAAANKMIDRRNRVLERAHASAVAHDRSAAAAASRHAPAANHRSDRFSNLFSQFQNTVSFSARESTRPSRRSDIALPQRNLNSAPEGAGRGNNTRLPTIARKR